MQNLKNAVGNTMITLLPDLFISVKDGLLFFLFIDQVDVDGATFRVENLSCSAYVFAKTK